MLPVALNRRRCRIGRLALAATSALLLSSCSFFTTFSPKPNDDSDVIDRQQHLTVNDFRKLNDVESLKKSEVVPADVVPGASLGTPPLPGLAQVLAAPKPPKVANAKLVTLSVTEDVPLRDVLFELGRLAGVDIEVGSGLDTTGINLRATDRPFNEVIDRIAQLGKLRYSTSGSSIRVERDTPYIKNYSLDFLNLVRSTASTYTLSTNILSAGGSSGSSGSSSGSSSSSSGGGGSGGGGVGSSGSTNSITSQGESDLFSSLEASITEILNYKADNGSALTATTSGTTGQQSGGAAGGATNFVVNRQSNVLTVNATQAQHDMIQLYLNMLTRNSSAQVLIEAKIVEVSLSDQFLSGVNWSKVIGSGSLFGSPGSYVPVGSSAVSFPTTLSKDALAATPLNNAFSAGFKNGDLEAVVAMTQRFGTTRTLSSPRLSAINNQQAVLTFARNQVFFNCTAQAGTVVANQGTSGSTATQPTVNCSQQTVPLGIIMSILPSINLNTQEVTLNVRPTLTRQVATVQNPGNILAAAVVSASSAINSDVPVIEVRELDSVMKIKSGGVMVIGGLMEEGSRNEFNGVPGANEIPILGNLFKSRNEDSIKRELIIFIKATIVNSDGSSSEVDRQVYDKYTTEPRPLFPKYESLMWSNVRYVLLTATRDRLFFGLLIGVLAAAYISNVLGSTALLESAQMSLTFTAASARVIIMVGLVVFIGFHMKNAFEAREIDVLLSRPISRTTLVLSYWLGFAAVAVLLVLPTIALIALLGTINQTGFMLWAASLLLESLLVVSIALFAALTMQSGVATVLSSLAMYTLSRMMGFFVIATKGHALFGSVELTIGVRWLMQAISTVIPRLDFYAKSSWLVYGAKSYDDLYLFLMQSAVFIPLLVAASVIDFKRKQF